MQPPFTHMEYSSPLLMLKDKSASLFRDITASLSEEEDDKRGKWREGLRFRGCAGTPPAPAIQEILLSQAMMLISGLLTTCKGERKRRQR